MKTKSKRTLTPKLRFPEFRDEPGWEESTVGELITTVSPPKKLTTSQYFPEGRFPIVDQSPDDQCGRTNDVDAIVKNSLPLIIFGDHTCVLKLVNQPFAQGADGIRIFKPKRSVSIEYLYQFLCARPLVMENYKRHFSILKGMQVFYPKGEESEQQKIAECLSSLDGLITAEGRTLEALRDHKRGLMQRLFPQPGETQPRLRFPEFRDKGEWEEVKLGQLGKLVSGLTYSPEDVRDNGLLVLRSSNIQDGKIVLEDCVYVTPTIKGANLTKPNDILICVRNGSKPLIGKNAMIPDGIPKCTHGAFMTILRAHAAFFVFQLLQTSAFQEQVAADLGATINSINNSNLLRYRFFVPTEPLEQKRIADCLSALDTQITAQAAKIDALKAHKRGLMQQLFPAPEEQ